MSETAMDRAAILERIYKIMEIQERIVEAVDSRLCCPAESGEEEWLPRRERIGKEMKSFIAKYFVSHQLPHDEMGIAAQSIISLLLKIQHTLAEIVIMIDMVGSEAFEDIYMDALTTISTKIRQQFAALKNMVEAAREDPETPSDILEVVLRLEREIDEDNIVICRQISVATAGGESGFVCYMMRKIVRELEHISDFIKEVAEIISDF